MTFFFFTVCALVSPKRVFLSFPVGAPSCPLVGSLQDSLSHALDGLEPIWSVGVPVWSGV
jgi:hypothetical protein